MRARRDVEHRGGPGGSLDGREQDMTEQGPADPGEALSRAQDTIERQAAEIEALRARLADELFARDLKQALVLAATAGAIAAPVTHSRLLELIVQTSMHVTSAEQGTLFLIDEDARELLFAVTVGPHSAPVQNLRVPLGHGIAGLVAITGEPMIVSEANRDPRQASDIARATGYTPKTILCVPLIDGDRIIGALEMMDKRDAQSFAPSDMEALGLFAGQAAVAIEQSFTTRNISDLLVAALGGWEAGADERRRALRDGARSFARRLEESPLYDRALNLAALVREIVRCGESELKLCETILRGVAEHLRSRPGPDVSGTEP